MLLVLSVFGDRVFDWIFRATYADHSYLALCNMRRTSWQSTTNEMQLFFFLLRVTVHELSTLRFGGAKSGRQGERGGLVDSECVCLCFVREGHQQHHA